MLQSLKLRSLGLTVRIKKRFEVRKRHQTSHLDLTMLGYEPEGREFESLRPLIWLTKKSGRTVLYLLRDFHYVVSGLIRRRFLRDLQ
jgi:hypothetical protein